MSRSEPSLEPQLARLRAHLREERYSRWVTWNYVTSARRFLRALERRGQPLESVSAADVERYLDGLKRQRDRLTLPAPWRRQHQAAIHMLLRLVHGKWPPEIAPTTADEIAMHEVICDYDAWMVELRGLSASTREHGRTEAHSLLRWLCDHGKSVATLSVAELDAYVAWRGASMRRTSIAQVISTLRGVLRYLHRSGRMPVDLAGTIEGPPIYVAGGHPVDDTKGGHRAGVKSRPMRSLTAGPSRLRDLDVALDLRPARRRDQGAAPVGHRLAARATSDPAREDRGVLGTATAARPCRRIARLPEIRTTRDDRHAKCSCEHWHRTGRSPAPRRCLALWPAASPLWGCR